MTYKLYYLYEKKTGKVFYIGQTSKSLKKRLSQHISASKSNKNRFILNKIRKMNSENIDFDIDLILESDEKEFLNQKEIEWISWCRKMFSGLCNIGNGGEECPTKLNSVKMKIKEKWRDPDFRKLMSEKTKKQWKDKNFSMIVSNAAKKLNKQRLLDDDWLQNVSTKASVQMKKQWKDKEWRKKIEKPCAQFALDGTKIASFDSITIAANLTNSNKSKIGDCCNGKRKTHNGFVWRFKND